MKLKKIASLMLAGVLAVSMLAACGEGAEKNPASSNETATASGYSAMLAKELKDTAAKSYVKFEDNAKDKTALEDMLGGIQNSVIVAAGQAAGAGLPIVSNQYTDEFVKDAGADDYIDGQINFDDQLRMNGTWKVAKIYAADGTVNINNVIKTIAENLDDDALAANFVEKAVDANGVHQSKYSYVVSVSVVNVKGTENLEWNQSTNVVAVTVTRTGVDN